MSDQQPVSFEPGHEWVYRLTASGGEGKVETRYYLSPYEVGSWVLRLQESGYQVAAARVAAEAFTVLTEAELDELASKEVASVRGEGAGDC